MSTVARRKAENKQKGKTGAKQPHRSTVGLAAGVVNAILEADGDVANAAFSEWGRYLQNRKFPVDLSQLTGRRHLEPLLWSVAEELRNELNSDDSDSGLRSKKHRKTGKGSSKHKRLPATTLERQAAQAEAWLSAVDPTVIDDVSALTALRWSHRLPALASHWQLAAWRQALDVLVRMSQNGANGTPWASQLLTCELPLSLAYCFPEIPRCADLAVSATEALEVSISELLDGQGMPAAANIPWMPVLGACWTRCFFMLRSMQSGSPKEEVAEEFEWFIRQFLRLMRTDGGMPFEPRCRDKRRLESTHVWVRAALTMTGDREDRQLAKAVFKPQDAEERRLPEDPAYHSEWAQLAVLQPEWSPKKPRLTVDFSSVTVRVELCNAGEVLFSCDWDPIMTANGKRLHPREDAWESVCWFSDFDVDFLELELELTEGWHIQRQFLVARQDYFLYIADNLVGPAGSKFEYQLAIPCGDGMQLRSKSDSREGFICGKRKTLGLFLPLGLPEWRSDSRPGESSMCDGTLEFRYRSDGQATCAPLFIDLHRRRMRKPVTWRRLTIAEHLQILPPDRAAGFRVHVGPEQWLIYRSLVETGNRTILGQNLTSEFLFARFLQDGDVETLIEIE